MNLKMRPSADLPLHFQDPSEELQLNDRDTGTLQPETECTRDHPHGMHDHNMESYPSSKADEFGNSSDGHLEDHSSNKRTANSKQSNSKQSTKSYECQFCGWKFNLKANLLAHVRRHTGEKPYSCTQCSRKFTQSSLLTVHMRTHTGERPFKCPTCNRWFSRSGNLLTHMRTHTNVKPYVCSFCSKGFAQRVNMELHTRIHTGVKPYKCGVCERAFTSCSNMRRHWKQIHPNFPEPHTNSSHASTSMLEKALLYSEEIPQENEMAPTNRLRDQSGFRSSFETESTRDASRGRGEETSNAPRAAGQHHGQTQQVSSDNTTYSTQNGYLANENTSSILPIAPPVHSVGTYYPQYTYAHSGTVSQPTLSSSTISSAPHVSLPPIQQASAHYHSYGIQNMQNSGQKHQKNYTVPAPQTVPAQQTLMGPGVTSLPVQRLPHYETYSTSIYSSAPNSAVSINPFPVQISSNWVSNNESTRKGQPRTDNIMVYSTQNSPANVAKRPQEDRTFAIPQ